MTFREIEKMGKVNMSLASRGKDLIDERKIIGSPYHKQ